MKSILYIIVGIFMLCSCSDNTVAPTPAPAEYKFEFKELKSDKTRLSVNESVKLTAVVVGDGLTYLWHAKIGNIYANGAEANFSICHADNSIVTCLVTDKYGNNASKQISLSSYFPSDSAGIK